MDKKEEQTVVDEHRKMFVMTGNLSDFQLQNLKSWPFLLFENIKQVKVDYDFVSDVKEGEELSAGKIIFDLEFKLDPEISGEKKTEAFNKLGLWTKFLFWNDTEVQILRDGKKW